MEGKKGFEDEMHERLDRLGHIVTYAREDQLRRIKDLAVLEEKLLGPDKTPDEGAFEVACIPMDFQGLCDALLYRLESYIQQMQEIQVVSANIDESIKHLNYGLFGSGSKDHLKTNVGLVHSSAYNSVGTGRG